MLLGRLYQQSPIMQIRRNAKGVLTWLHISRTMTSYYDILRQRFQEIFVFQLTDFNFTMDSMNWEKRKIFIENCPLESWIQFPRYSYQRVLSHRSLNRVEKFLKISETLAYPERRSFDWKIYIHLGITQSTFSRPLLIFFQISADSRSCFAIVCLSLERKTTSLLLSISSSSRTL